MARSFRDEFSVGCQLLTDPGRQVYSALGLPRGVSLITTLKTAKSGVRAMKSGHRQGAMAGDPWQLGGVLLTDESGLVRYRRVSQYAGDHPAMPEILAAVRGLATPMQSQ